MTNSHNPEDTSDLGDDLEITKITRRDSGGGTWVIGDDRRTPFRSPGLPRTCRMPGLRIGRQPDLKALAAADRRQDDRSQFCTAVGTTGPANTIAAAIVDFLAAGLADFAYGA